MKFRLLFGAFVMAASICSSVPTQTNIALAPKPKPESVRIILLVDSTMATRTGYGDALCSLFQPNAECVNLARGGRSSMSFRAEGLWDNVMALLREPTSPSKTYVLIQFGHNDQPGKPGRSTDLATEFPVNIARYADEVKSLGGVPVLVTPLTRRSFRDGVLQNDLTRWADVTRNVAATKSVPLIELNALSYAAVARMGTAEADRLAEEPPPPFAAYGVAVISDAAKAEPNVTAGAVGIAKNRFDYTHVGAKGAALFSKMVARDLVKAVPSLTANVRADALK